MNPFLTTILKNNQDIKLRESVANPITQLFINADGYQKYPTGNPAPNEYENVNGDFYFYYPIKRMLNDRGNGALVQPAVDRWVGANQIQMSFDDVENKLKFDIQHFPIYTGESAGVGANDAKPTAVFNPATSQGSYITNSGLALQYSGLVWTDLSPAPFWNDTLGFIHLN